MLPINMEGHRAHGRLVRVLASMLLLISPLELANYWASDCSSINHRRLSLFAAADGAIEDVLPTKAAASSLRTMHIKGQERSSDPFELGDRELARKKQRAVKKRGANKKKRTNKERVNVKRARGNDKKKTSRNNSRGNGKTKKRMGDEMDSEKKKMSGNSGGKKNSNSANKKSSSNNNKKSSSNNKKKTSKASKKDSKSDKSKSDEMWYPKFDSIMCTSGGGRPLVGFNPMYYAATKQACCMRHFPSMAAECMLRSSASSIGMTAGGKPGIWGGSSSTWMGGAQPSWGAGVSGGTSKGGKSGKSGGGTSTTIVYIAMPGEAEVETDMPTDLPTSFPTALPTALPTTYIPTYYPTDLPTEEAAIVDTVIPTYSPTPGNYTDIPTAMPTLMTEEPTSSSETGLPTMEPSGKAAEPTMTPSIESTIQTDMPTIECSNTNWFFWGAEDGIGGSIAKDQAVPLLKNEPVLDLSAGSRYTLLIDSEGDAFASGFIESKFEYLGQFGVASDKLEEGQNDWRKIDQVADLSGKSTGSPSFAKAYAGASANSNAGEQHSLLIDKQGKVYTFGNNDRGQLCLGDNDPRYIPNQVKLDGSAIAAAIGEDFTLILLDDGSVYGCGSNEKGELGLGSGVKSVDKPENGNGLKDIVELYSGLNYALFHAAGGEVYSTGSNIYAQQCRDTNGEPIFTPEELPSLASKSIQSIMAGSESSYFLFVDGTVASCGRNDEGQLGDGTFIDQVKTFVIIPNNDIIEKLGSGPSSQSVFFIGENDLVYGAGANDRFQLGLGAPGKIAFPNLVAFDDPVFDVLKISSSGTHTVAINELICTNFPTATPTVTPTAYPTLSPTVPETNSWLYWGANEGRGETLGTNQEIPELIDEDIIDVVAGPRYTLKIDAEGYAYASGFIESKFEYLGHFGVEPDLLEEGPNNWQRIEKVADLNGKETNAPDFAKVYAGASGTANSGETHSLLIDQQGNVYTFGNNDRGQLCLGGNDPRYIPNQVSLKEPAMAAAIGEDFTLILLEDGSVFGCGSNEKGEIGLGNSIKSADKPDNGNGLKDIVDLSAGLNHALFQSKSGNILGTGSNIYMQLCEFTDGEPVTTPKAIKALGELKVDVSMIAAGRESSYLLLENGFVKACGRNDEGQLGDGTFVNNEFTDVLIPMEDIVSNLGSGPSSQSVFFFGENAVYGSGANDRFQLGLGEIGSQTLPVQVDFTDLATVDGIIKISSSGTHTVALNVPVDMPLSDTGIPTFSPTAGNGTGIPTFSPTVGNGTDTGDTGIPTFSPTVQPTTLGVESDIPTFSPTATPTVGAVIITSMPTTSPTYMVTIPVPTASPTYKTTLPATGIVFPTVSPTYNGTTPVTVIAEPTPSPTYMNMTVVEEPTPSPSSSGSGEPTFVPSIEAPTPLEALPTAVPTILASLLATVLFVSGDPASVGEVEDEVLLVPTDGNELIIDASAGSGYTLVVLNDGLAAAGGIVGDTYAGHLGLADVVEGIIELTVITNFTDLDGNELAEPPMMSSVKAGVETSVGSGLQHSIFIDVDGNAYASGNNDKGQLCLGDTDSRLTPFQIDLPEPAVYAAVGGDFTLILTESGTVYGCGSNELGQLGLGPDIDSALLPNSGNDLADVLSVSAGLNFALFRTADGIFVTGDNTYGQLCINPETEMLDTPSLIADVDGSAVEMFEAGYQSSYILFGLDDSAAACGLNDVGQLGDNTTVSQSRTTPIIPGKDKIINLGIGASSKSAFFLSDNAIYATGLNDFGQLGIDDGSVTEVSEPTKVVFATNVTLYNISPGDSQTLYW